MDKMQEATVRLNLAAKGLENNTPQELGFTDLRDLAEWVVAPSKQSIVAASVVPSVTL